MTHAKLPQAEAQGLLKQLKKGDLTLRNMVRQAKAHKPSLKILQAQDNGFRLMPFRFDKAKTPADQKKHMIEALKQALAVLEKG